MFNKHLDPTRVVERINNLLSHRWSLSKIAREAGITHSTVVDIHRGTHKKITRKNFDAIMAIPPLPGCVVTWVGFKRRVQGLMWMGYPQGVIAREMGLTMHGLATAYYQGRFSVDMGIALVDTYARISHIPGASGRVRLFARRRRYAPPAAWDDDTIDTAPDLASGIVLRNTLNQRGRFNKVCVNGHAMSGDNVVVRPSGHRRCRECHKINNRLYRARRSVP